MQIPRGYDQYVSANGSIPVISNPNSASQKTPQVQEDISSVFGLRVFHVYPCIWANFYKFHSILKIKGNNLGNKNKVTKWKWYNGTTDGKMGVIPLMHLCGTLNAEILIELKFIHFRLLEMSFDWVNVLFYKMKFYTQGDVNFHGQI